VFSQGTVVPKNEKNDQANEVVWILCFDYFGIDRGSNDHLKVVGRDTLLWVRSKGLPSLSSSFQSIMTIHGTAPGH
jgi:hypothetical protein